MLDMKVFNAWLIWWSHKEENKLLHNK